MARCSGPGTSRWLTTSGSGANRTVRLLKDHKAGRVSEIDPVDCLFIRSDLPDLRGLLADLTQPIRRQNPTTGKWELDKRGGE